MARRKAVNTDNQITALKAEAAKYAVRVKDQPGLYVRVTPAGAKTFSAVARDPYGKQIWATIGGTELKVDEARDKAKAAIKRIKAGLAPFEEPPVQPDSFEAVAENWMTRHVKAKGLRSEGELRRQLDIYILPAWKGRDFVSIRKSDVAKLLDDIEDNHGPVQADRVLATVRGIMRWQASRDDDYACVITGKMRRTDPVERRRARVLDDDEIRLIWQVAGDFGTYGEMVRFGLLTGQRIAKIASIKWDDVNAAGHWRIETEVREKGNGTILPLPSLAFDIIRQQSKVEGNAHVFTGRGESHFKGFGKAKRRLDEAITAARAKALGEAVNAKKHSLPGWRFHDLRRTAETLMARAGVSDKIADKVTGHTGNAIRETYDRHDYTKERGDALKALAGLIERILNPPADNVRPIKEGRPA